jgi:Fe2+ or Zn2+ uptake regulation protein
MTHRLAMTKAKTTKENDMKVKDLIEELSKLDPNTTVLGYDSLDTQYRPLGRLQKVFFIKERNQTGGRIVYKQPKVTASEEALVFYPTAK